MRFLTALVTLDPSVINFERVKNEKTVGATTLQNGLTLRGQKNGKFDYISDDVRTSGTFDEVKSYILYAGAMYLKNTWDVDLISDDELVKHNKKAFELGTYQSVSAADGLNKANLTYFVELFTSMNEIYKHLQNLLFIVIGGWFVGTIGTQKFLKYLEHKGEGSGGNQPYLHKFLIPILGVSFFFAPIPEGNLPNQSTTIVQNIIRYFTATGNQIADMAGAIGSKVYIDKLYNSVGGNTEEMEFRAKYNKVESDFLAGETSNLFKTLCIERFPAGVLNELATTTNQAYGYKDVIGTFDVNKVVNNQDITANTCWRALNEQAEYTRNSTLYNAQIKGYDNYLSNKGGAETLQKSLTTIDRYITTKDQELGWLNTTIIPGTGLMIEVQDFMIANAVQSKDNKNDIVAVTTQNEQAALETSIKGKRNPGNVAQDTLITYVTSNLAYMALPGAKMIQDSMSSILSFVGGAVGLLSGPLGSLGLSKLAGGLGSLAGIPLAIWMMKLLLTFVPAVVATLAGAIAFVSYITALCKYFYISPFVVAFSITIKRQEKIIDFLLAGVSIFFKPILIVLFVYLSLFLHTLIKEIILLISVSQFSVLKVLDTNLTAQLAIGGIRGLMTIMATMASCYILWKLIVKGPDWVMDLIGIKGGQDSIVADGLAQKLERRGTMIH